ncbi:MAG TPA: FadR/GntR family transcriptional regulator [Bryobacteraceae bacterium]|jgi:GntR family transcriptional repressor for pyruvate dehydrogenase complex|nr:FadR/GntR family transcriptional regulator [Bryobacteraceae bacterium]
MKFDSIRRNKVYEEVAEKLQQWILHDLHPGAKLPPERELVEMFGVSRSSIRDAIHKLQLSGFVETRQGVGTVVRESQQRQLVVPLTSLGELLEVRKMIEPPLAALAAVRASAEDLGEMRQILRRQAEKVDRGEAAIDEDADFHYSIALAANNSVVLKILDSLMGLLNPTRAQQVQVPGRPQRSLAGHQAILAAMERRDAAAAEAAMRQHLNEVESMIDHQPDDLPSESLPSQP